jgi:L-asparaginase
MPSCNERVVILGTGGTIAGTAGSAAEAVGYRAAQLGVERLVAAVPALAGAALECEQVAQLNSKDMTHAVWQRLAQRCAHHLARDDVAGVVVTHGTDTLEETAYFLHRVLAPAKPLVLTAAMRPATSMQADGPQNLLDAVTVARGGAALGWRGVMAVLNGTVHAAVDVRKVHGWRLDAFASGDAGPVGAVVAGTVRRWRDVPACAPAGLDAVARDTAQWPRVEVVTSHAGASGRVVDALVADGVDGLVVAATGFGDVHAEVQAALDRARARGVAVAVATRCAYGPVIDAATHAVDARTPWQMRIDLLLERLRAG